ncbi:phosphoenolpyruvate--protein phosphotransferase [Tamaricihabitans halophyticus]|uniref:Phosphoenolpyruvate-protein phosphotransferase n=1 Tax=Tamaricihabitans halophyticus TaxID=1262583 RepID=A0A4V2SUG7_9PSEU|nr:phosphoenolpyruvate--protein phosphotransferase [Tamaricihabitans halophyticus]TCP54026.1 phosphoenolpyruvate--protein phosphotransferase [Tamaricihabitans halophyticus]
MSERVLHGIGVSPGRAYGPVVPLATGSVAEPGTEPAAEPDAEVARLAPAIDRVVAELERRAEAASGSAAEVLSMTAMMAGDPTLLKHATERVRGAGRGAERAIWEAAEGFAESLKASGGYFAERAADLYDVRNRVVAELRGVPQPGIPTLTEPAVLTAHDLAPADTATLDASKVLALVTAEGGPTSHTAILARSLGIPAVVACAGITEVAAGERLLVDGETGEARTGVAAEDVPNTTQLSTVEFSGALVGTVSLAANVGEPTGARTAGEVGARNVGLLRTEFLFEGRQTAPTEDEQAAAYDEVLSVFPDGRVVIRTLDVGADKPLAFVPLDPSPNPALGVRGLRIALADPELLDVQLAAIARVAAGYSGELWTMAPMVATPEEARWFAERARGHGLRNVGVMIEVPAAALHAERILAEVDFVSIGTNDLAQYTFAADRQSAGVAALNDPWQPALLSLISTVGAAGRTTGKPVGVCGEAAADPLLAAVLVGLGVTSLSMTPRALPAVGAKLSELDEPACARIAAAALAAGTAEGARTAARGA